MAMAPELVTATAAVPLEAPGPSGAPDRPGRTDFLTRRTIPLLGSAVFAVVAVNYALWWVPTVNHVDSWWVPGDFWINYFGASAFVHGHWATMYALHTRLNTLPGVFVLLSPAVLIAQALHLSLGAPYTAISTPTTWLALEPCALLAASVVLFSLDALARRLEVGVRRRAVLMAAEVVALWDLLAMQWHPEDALAVAFAVWGLLAAFDGRWRRSGWLFGLGIACQPLAVMALAGVVALAPRRSALGILVRAGVPGALLIAGPLIANPSGTLRGVFAEEGRLISVADHPTPWMHFAPHLGGGLVAAGPARMGAVIAAVVVGWTVCRRTRRPELVVWVVALCFALRTLFESVMVAYYIWPALALALVAAARASRVRFAVAGAASSFATAFALLGWQNAWAWWSVLVACLAAVLVAAWPAPRPRFQPTAGPLAGRSHLAPSGAP